MGSGVVGRKLAISLKKGVGKLKRAMIKAPLLVFGKIWVRSAGEEFLVISRSKSSEIRSVKLSVLPIGMSTRSFLIQKISMAGREEKPIKVQPMEFWKYNSVMPPKSRAINTTRVSASIGGLFSACFWWAFLTRGF